MHLIERANLSTSYVFSHFKGISRAVVSVKVSGLRFKVFKAVSVDEGSLAGCEPLARFEPRTHKLRGWIVDFPSQVPLGPKSCMR